MNKKLFTIGATGLAGLVAVVFSCSREQGSPPSHKLIDSQRIAEMRGFFESEVGAPTLPDTYYKGGGVTRSTQNLLSDAVSPDWPLAVTWENDRILGTQVPAIITRTVEYAALIEYRSDTVSFTIQAPQVWILFNERKDDGETLCFLATLLPDSAYAGDPAAIGSNPAGTDFWGLAIYSLPDGTPMWGVRYEEGTATNRLIFSSETDLPSDTDLGVGLGFGTAQTTRVTGGQREIIIEEVICVGVSDADDDDYGGGRDEGDYPSDVDDRNRYEIFNLGGGGGSTIKVGAPNADRLFNGNLTEQQWKALEAMINKIMADCMGGMLYNALNSLGLNLIYDPSAATEEYNHNTNTVTIKNLSNYVVLTHELFHSYQAHDPTTLSGWNNKISNIETETRLAELLFLKRNRPDLVGKYYQPNEFKPLLMELSRYVDRKGQLVSGHETDFFNALKSAVESYHNVTGDTFSLTPENLNVDNLQQLSNNC